MELTEIVLCDKLKNIDHREDNRATQEDLINKIKYVDALQKDFLITVGLLNGAHSMNNIRKTLKKARKYLNYNIMKRGL